RGGEPAPDRAPRGARAARARGVLLPQLRVRPGVPLGAHDGARRRADRRSPGPPGWPLEGDRRRRRRHAPGGAAGAARVDRPEPEDHRAALRGRTGIKEPASLPDWSDGAGAPSLSTGSGIYRGPAGAGCDEVVAAGLQHRLAIELRRLARVAGGPADLVHDVARVAGAQRLPQVLVDVGDQLVGDRRVVRQGVLGADALHDLAEGVGRAVVELDL